MGKINIAGAKALEGKVRIGGAKNASLPILAATLLSESKNTIKEIPPLKDVLTICEVLKQLGCSVEFGENGEIDVDSSELTEVEASHELVRQMRASFLVIGPLLARMKKARIPLPGGCAIGSRPIDLHLKGFAALGADIKFNHGFVEATCDELIGDRVYLDFPSVGATENLMMAATRAKGETIIENAAEEPEVVDLANFLNKLGAKVVGAGTDTIKIEGVKELSGTEHTVIPDRIEAGTFMAAAAISRGDVLIENVISEHVKPVMRKMEEMGVSVTESDGNVRINAKGRQLKPVKLKTLPYPGYPTDMQPQMVSLLSTVSGESIVTETVFENRFRHVEELKRMSANIIVQGNSAIINGASSLLGAPIKATDLRAGASLVLAGLVAEGNTQVHDMYHLERGYYGFIDKLSKLGAEIWKDHENIKKVL